MDFHASAIDFRQEAIEDKNDDGILNFGVWAFVSIRYGLRVVRFRSEFYKMAAKDPVHAELVILSRQQRNEVAASDNLTEPLEKLDSHMSTQLMKAAATLDASNAKKRSKGKGGAADEHSSQLAFRACFRLRLIRESRHGAA